MNWLNPKAFIAPASWVYQYRIKSTAFSTVGTGVHTLLAEKRSNNPGELPKTVGYLYRSGIDENDILYSADNPDNPTFLFKWDNSLTDGKNSRYYSIIIDDDNNVVCVYRGELEAGPLLARQNPIVYPANDYANPVVVDLPINPTGWLQNCGADHVADYFIFGEYTRPVHTKSYVWKVEKPYINTSNWKIVIEQDVPGVITFEHFHTAQYDTYSGSWFVTTGDNNAAVMVYTSTDDGETWNIIASGSQAFRTLNFIFTVDCVYWASDAPATLHGLYSVSRTENAPDFSVVTTLKELPRGQPTYVTALISEPYGLLLLGRVEGTYMSEHNSVSIYFWDFTENKIDVIGNVFSRFPAFAYGFRCRATTFYPNNSDERVLCGFDVDTSGLIILTETEKTIALTVSGTGYQFIN